MHLLQASTGELTKRLPNFEELVYYYGPYLALVLGLVISFLIMQYVWFNKSLQARKEEINRLTQREKALMERFWHIIDNKTDFKNH